ncbi:hypothetical protein GCM10011588_17870 [Nocardia jinanensis]|uniref:Uncharacterized protein n=1 Tax=Nocardia jinanensis TaxID=382504 RepID=A0A917RDV4_9NOCA|nr:hypothetical protein GCM10011588_17870 [Nocardia jinanensis]
MDSLFRFSQHKQQDYTARVAETPDELGVLLGSLVDAGADVFDANSRRFDLPAFEGSDLSPAGWAKKLTGAHPELRAAHLPARCVDWRWTAWQYRGERATRPVSSVATTSPSGGGDLSLRGDPLAETAESRPEPGADDTADARSPFTDG